MKKILVIGSLNIDFSLSVDNLPNEGETINANELYVNNGGKGANQACTIGKLGGNVSMLGLIGKDEYGKKLKKDLKVAGVNVKGIKVNKTKDTGKAFINVDKNGNNIITIFHGANYEVNEKFISDNIKYIKNADIILIQLEIPISTIKKIIDIAKDKVVILDPAPANKEIMNFDLNNIYLIKPNETEIEGLTGIKIENEDDYLKASSIILKKGVKNVVISLGDKGCVLVNEKGLQKFPAIKANVVDTTAAGDSFIASIVYALSNNMTLEESITLASKVASIVVSRKGAQNSIPTLSEVNND